ncbi:flippase-like domain-containing protein [Halovenus rubra]|uniref:Flippase-like domain-containing protein n=2 Tax=Halovenus rubra TaxID=869890 RepID=A0ACC7E4M5_9EURY|nr:flippase-like domain-containing protein [Halovenus rubra]
MSRVDVSVVLPAYNEAETLTATVKTTLSTLGSFLSEDNFEVIIAEDGCEDKTPEIATDLASTHQQVRHIHSNDRLGRGGALEYAFREADGETLVYFDTDLATDMSHLEELVESIRTGEYDVATGSRWLPASDADRPAKRGIPSLGYNRLVRFFLRSDLQDHQCGFKAFDRDVLFALLDEVEDSHWFWDTEVLVRAQHHGYRVKEFPVDWNPKGDSKVDIVRDVFGMGSQILRTWWQLAVSPRITRTVTLTVGSLLAFVALALMTLYLDPSEVIESMQSADPLIVLIGAIIYLISWPLRGLRYRDILETISYRERWGFLTGAVFISQTGNLVFPARAGDAVRAYIIKARQDIPYPSGFASLAVERVYDLLTITLMAGFVLVGLAATGSLGEVQAALLGQPIEGSERQSGQAALFVAAGVGFGAILAVALIIYTARTDKNYVRPVIQRVSSDSYADYVAGIIEQFVGDIQTVAQDRNAFLRVGLTSLVIWVFDVIVAIVVLLAFNVAVPLPLLIGAGFFAVSVGNLAKVLPLSPGGIGLYEGAFTLLIVALTPIGPAVALSAAIVDHAVKNIVTVIGGVSSMALLDVSLTTAVEESREAEMVQND